jgi:hypothetical protein
MLRHRQKCHSVAKAPSSQRRKPQPTAGTAESGLNSVGKTGAEI